MYTNRINQKVIIESINRKFITGILGPRQVGKTFFIENFISTHSDRVWVFLTMDKMEQRERAKKSELQTMISELAKQNIGEKNKIWVVIDEAQKCPELFDQIKLIYDEYKDTDKIKFIITGSAQLSLYKLSTESLAGRIELYYLYEFNLRESTLFYEPSVPLDSILECIDRHDIQAIENLIKNLSPFKPFLEKQLQQHLIWGGFPELLSIHSSYEKINYLNNYLQTYLEKDVRAIESISDLNLYRNMMDVLAEQTGSIRDDQKTLNALGCTRDTLKKYRGYLEATLLYVETYPYIGSTMKRLVKSPKGYLINNGLISVLTGIHETSYLTRTGIIGHRFENWFLNEILTWNARTPVRKKINYWRTSAGVEIDFVVVKKPDVFPFEVTFNSHEDGKKIRNLKIFLMDEPKAKWGYYIYGGPFKIDQKNRIVYLPSWAIG